MPLMYCESFPSVVIDWFSFTGPFMMTGHEFFSFESVYACAPICLSASKRCKTGRVRNDSSPVKTLNPSKIAAIGDIKYKSEPESPQSTTFEGRCAFFPAPSTIHSELFEMSTFAPNSFTA